MTRDNQGLTLFLVVTMLLMVFLYGVSEQPGIMVTSVIGLPIVVHYLIGALVTLLGTFFITEGAVIKRRNSKLKAAFIRLQGLHADGEAAAVTLLNILGDLETTIVLKPAYVEKERDLRVVYDLTAEASSLQDAFRARSKFHEHVSWNKMSWEEIEELTTKYEGLMEEIPALKTVVNELRAKVMTAEELPAVNLTDETPAQETQRKASE